ncbi:ATP-binding protein [Leptodesmis sichuanensis]|uniref:ATP-binding protein n=1 Tax=Leptodesmis sichuanensis TaxID=2906798 RepID=UPI001F25930F|nr:ATP-binding protein [Leptodesmis sichuanensis]
MNSIARDRMATLDLPPGDREPIHIPGAIQPHGVLLLIREADLTIVQVSANTAALLGREPEELLNTPLNDLLGAAQVEMFSACLDGDFNSINPLHLMIPHTQQAQRMDGMIHQTEAGLILELEPAQPEEETDVFGFYHLVKGALNRMQSAMTLEQLGQVIVQEIRQLTGCDRVMVYQFDDSGAGQVIAEARQDALIPYLGLHYPAIDIPNSARQLYTLNGLRLIPDVHYQPVPLIPVLNPLSDRPTDLSLAVLRSVSPCHIEYLQNMAVAASMSISLIKQGRLWGLIACHHGTPKFIPYAVRIACEFLGQVMSMELIAKEANEDLDYKMKLKSIQAKFLETIPQQNQHSLINCLISPDLQLLDLVSAQGAAIYWNGEFTTLGNTPGPNALNRLLEWLESHTEDNLFYTDALPSLCQEAESYRSIASGLIALTISRTNRNYILWFRPEVLQTVNWGGNPNQPVEILENGEKRLTPRQSFALWQETVRGKSLPWKACEIEAVQELSSAIVGIVLRHADELARINIELERSNTELDAFAYVASHDLKEPLRGIHNYANFLIEDYGHVLSEDGVSKLQTLVRLTQRMEDLINSLLHFSRLGRVELNLQRVDLNTVVKNVLDVLSISKEPEVKIRIPRPLPTVLCDRIQVAELFTNLLSNAMKYNNKAEKWVEIGFLEGSRELGVGNRDKRGKEDREDGGGTSSSSPSPSPSPPPTPIFYIRDNGIGIRDRHLDNIFRIFKRLHGPSQYGGGTGAGLTIAKKIVERHGGRIWVESTYGEGSTFYFTLQS